MDEKKGEDLCLWPGCECWVGRRRWCIEHLTRGMEAVDRIVWRTHDGKLPMNGAGQVFWMRDPQRPHESYCLSPVTDGFELSIRLGGRDLGFPKQRSEQAATLYVAIRELRIAQGLPVLELP